MIPPYELENKQFKKAVKGYNTTDVDEHIDFIVEKYTELYRAYNELERKHAEVSAELEMFRNNEDAIRRALVEAQNTKSKIIKDATRRSDVILKSSKENCDRIIADFKEQINHERSTLATLKAQVEEFKYRIFSQYQQHIEYLEQISPDKDTGSEWNLPTSEFAGKVVAQIVLDVEKSELENEASKDSADIRTDDDNNALDTFVADIEHFDVEHDENASDGGEEGAQNSGDLTAEFNIASSAGIIPRDTEVLREILESSEDNGESESDTLMFLINDLKKGSEQ